jgi:hemerythrin-like domain-containing protein
MLSDHAEGRGYVAVLREIAAAPGDWTDDERNRAARALEEYASLLTAHILKEDQVLYPMARQHLPGEAYAEVARLCAEFEASRAATGESERIVALGERLIATYAAAGR